MNLATYRIVNLLNGRFFPVWKLKTPIELCLMVKNDNLIKNRANPSFDSIKTYDELHTSLFYLVEDHWSYSDTHYMKRVLTTFVPLLNDPRIIVLANQTQYFNTCDIFTWKEISILRNKYFSSPIKRFTLADDKPETSLTRTGVDADSWNIDYSMFEIEETNPDGKIVYGRI